MSWELARQLSEARSPVRSILAPSSWLKSVLAGWLMSFPACGVLGSRPSLHDQPSPSAPNRACVSGGRRLRRWRPRPSNGTCRGGGGFQVHVMPVHPAPPEPGGGMELDRSIGPSVGRNWRSDAAEEVVVRQELDQLLFEGVTGQPCTAYGSPFDTQTGSARYSSCQNIHERKASWVVCCGITHAVLVEVCLMCVLGVRQGRWILGSRRGLDLVPC